TPTRGFVGLPAAETTTHVPRLREPCTSTISPTASLFNDSIIARRRNRFRDREAAGSALDSSLRSRAYWVKSPRWHCIASSYPDRDRPWRCASCAQPKRG